MKHKILKEIYLVKKDMTHETWRKVIETISKYEGLFKSWRFYIDIDKNEIHYYVEADVELPAQLVGVDSCIFKRIEGIKKMPCKSSIPKVVNPDYSIVDMLSLASSKHKGPIERVEILIKSFSKDKFTFKIYSYERKGDLIKRRVLLAIPERLLAVDFSKNNLYFYKKAPKYLNIQKILHLVRSDEQTSILKVDTFPYLQGDYYLSLNSFSFDRHSLVVGSSGSGKSKLLSLIIKNLSENVDYKMKYKVIVIDPHAALESDIGGLEDTKIIDFKSDESSIDVFKSATSTSTISSSEIMLDLFKNLIDNYNPKLERLLRCCTNLLLSLNIFSFNTLRKLLLETEYRVDLVKRSAKKVNSSIVNFFLQDYNEFKTKYYNETIAPIISFIDEMQMIPVFNNDSHLASLSSTIENNFLTIFSLDSEALGNNIIRTMSSLIMKSILELAESRTLGEHIILVVDEVSVIENPVLNRFLSEARKYGLSLILAEQYFDQVSDSLKNAIFANVANYYLFRLSKSDASLLANTIEMKLEGSHDEKDKANMLSGLNDRECIARLYANGLLYPAFKSKTVDFTSSPRKMIEVKPAEIVLDEEDLKIVEKKKFSIETNVSLNSLLMEQSSSREKLRR